MLNRKTLFPILFFLYSTCGLLAQTEKPNIIFILTDDQRWDMMAYAGNEIIHTPNMDQLAAEGCYFANSFVTTPICAASRASIMTGMYERSHDFTFNTHPLRRKLALSSYPALLKQNGYSTGFVGKFGMNFENRIDTALFDYYKRPGEWGGCFRYFSLNEDQTGYIHMTERIAGLSMEFINEQYQEGPFSLSISFHAPHADDQNPEQYIYPLDMEQLYQDVVFPEPLLYDPEYFNAQPEYVRTGLNNVRWYWRFDTPEKYQKSMKAYYRMISGIDKQLGIIREELERLGIADNTIIIFMGDNGYFLGERRLAGKWLMYENSLRVPFIVYDPRKEISPKRSEIMALNIDVAPTILDYAGVEIPVTMEGQSVRRIVEGAEEELRDHFLCEHLFDHDRIPKSEGIRTPQYKYFRYVDDPDHEELYDLQADPLETDNLANKTKYRKVLDEMRVLLEKEIDR